MTVRLATDLLVCVEVWLSSGVSCAIWIMEVWDMQFAKYDSEHLFPVAGSGNEEEEKEMESGSGEENGGKRIRI